MPLYIDDDTIARKLTMEDAIRCVDAVFREAAANRTRNTLRTRMAVEASVLNVMWGAVTQLDYIGVKSYVTAGRGMTRGTSLALLMYAMDSGNLSAIVEANRLGQLRTGAATAVATRILANPAPRILTIFGTGFQSEYQVRAVLAVAATVEHVCIVGRTAAHARDLIARLGRLFPAVRFSVESAREATQAADIIVTATASAEPLFEGAWLKPGVHINAMGSNDGRKREIGRDVLERAQVIAVDDMEVAQVECGDLLVNGWDVSSAATLGDVLVGTRPGRGGTDDITLFESHGLAIQDIACAAHVISTLGAGEAPDLTGD